MTEPLFNLYVSGIQTYIHTQLQSILGGWYVGDDESPHTLPHQFVHLSAGSGWHTRDDQGGPEQHRSTLLARHKVLLHQKLHTWSELFQELGVFSVLVNYTVLYACKGKYINMYLFAVCL